MIHDRRAQHDLDVLFDEHARELFALRRLERLTEAQERALERKLRELDDEHVRAAHRLEQEYRRTHFGWPPDSWSTRNGHGR